MQACSSQQQDYSSICMSSLILSLVYGTFGHQRGKKGLHIFSKISVIILESFWWNFAFQLVKENFGHVYVRDNLTTSYN